MKDKMEDVVCLYTCSLGMKDKMEAVMFVYLLTWNERQDVDCDVCIPAHLE